MSDGVEIVIGGNVERFIRKFMDIRAVNFHNFLYGATGMEKQFGKPVPAQTLEGAVAHGFIDPSGANPRANPRPVPRS